MSFHPQIADDTLFWINTASQITATGTPISSGSPAVATPQTSASLVPRVNPAYYAPPFDAAVRGLVMMQPVDGDILAQPEALNPTEMAYSLQIGDDFVLWQSDKGYEMYDAQTQGNVTVGADLNDAAFLAVNGSTAVWIRGTTNTTTSLAGSPLSLRIFAFNWPK